MVIFLTNSVPKDRSMPEKAVAIGADHRGFALKRVLIEDLAGRGLEVIDLGTGSDESVDYPDFARAVAESVAAGRAERGILVCGTGIGMSIGANRHKGVRAALCCTAEQARMSRRHNNANVLCLGADTISESAAQACVEAFLGTEFEGGRHERRVAKLG